MKKEKNIVFVCALIMLGLMLGFTGKVEAKSSTCKHLYGIESKVDHTYHYKKCLYCKNEVKEKHNLDKNGKCYTCKQIHGKGKMTITDGTYHYYTCKNTACRGTIKTKHTWENEKYGRIIKNATCNAKGQLELECTTSGCNRTKKVDIKKKSHNYKIVNNKVDHTYHYKKCSNCGASVAVKHTMKNNVCTVCKQVHGKGKMTITDGTYHYYTCKNADCRGTIKTKHTWEKEKYGEIVKEPTCTTKGKKELECTTSGCTRTKTLAIKTISHNYKVVKDPSTDSRLNVNHTYHYKKCTMCDSYIAEKHSFNKDKECKKCGQIHGVGEIYKTDTKNHYYKCSNNECNGTAKKAHTYTIVEKTDHKNHYLKCTDCSSIKIEKHNNKGKGKTCSVCGELHTLTIYKKDHENHYKKCVQSGCNERKVEKHTLNKNGKCTICKETHKTTYITDHEYHYIKCSNVNCTIQGEKEKHTLDKNGKCTICKETHKIISVDKNNGYHIVQCSKKNCTYPKTEEEHVYNKRDSKGRCESCKRFWKDTVIGIQGKLFKLGYYANQTKQKAVDGDAGKNTIQAINDFLNLEGFNIKINNKNDITTDIILKIQAGTRTRTEAEIAKTEAELGPYTGNYQYYQNDFGDVKYGSGTVADCGCGVTSMAMVATKLNGRWITPKNIVDWCGNKYYGSKGTSWNFYDAAAKKYGIKCTNVGKDKTKVISALKAGKMVICSQGKGLFTKNLHLIVLSKYNKDGTISVMDPNKDNAIGKDYNNRKFDFMTEIYETSRNYWVFQK